MSNENPESLIPTSQMRARYGGVSHMWVERRLKDDPEFPRPLYIATRRYWRIGELITWERLVATRKPAAKAA